LIDSQALTQITAAIGVLGHEILVGAASDAGKATWVRIKKLLGWASDPAPAEISQKATAVLTESNDPDLIVKLLALLKSDGAGRPAALVGKITVENGGKLVVADTIVTEQFNM